MSGGRDVWVISLARQRARRALVWPRFEAAGATPRWVEGVDGRSLPEELIRAGQAGARRRLTNGEIGCFHAHRRAWMRVIAIRAAVGWICEDDVVVDGGVGDDLDRALGELSEADRSWDLLYLVPRSRSAEFYEVCNPSHIAPELAASQPVRDHRVTASLQRAGPQLGLCSYVVSRVGAQRLLAATSAIQNPVDVQVSCASHLRRYLTVSASVKIHDFGTSDTNPRLLPREKDPDLFPTP